MPVAETVSKAALDLAISWAQKRLRRQARAFRLGRIALEKAVASHLTFVRKWSGSVQFLQLPKARDISDSTIKLQIQTEPRRFRTTQANVPLRDESDLLTDDENYVLLGEPGSGKTTTLKRLARMLLTTPPRHKADIFQMPLVLLLRELPPAKTVSMAVAAALGMSYKVVTRRKLLPGSAVPVVSEDTYVGDHPIERVVADALNELHTVLILDGLDEVTPDARDAIAVEVGALARTLDTAKVIISSRTGDYRVQIDGFTVWELCPLNQTQIRQIAGRWLPRPEAFLSAIANLPYHDVIDRPLLLCQLLWLYRRDGGLPEQPTNVYKRVVRLLLEEWDAQRGIKRRSKYAGFESERKADFLAALAYEMTYVLNAKRFTEEQLVAIYLKIRVTFNLPEGEARAVAREIQTHTGLIVAAGDGYEFSHLSLQEYLCANYLVRANIPIPVGSRFASYVAPLAVAVALSSQPGAWLGRMLLSEGSGRLGFDGVVSLLSRVVAERPGFEETELLGFGILALCDTVDRYERQDARAVLLRILDLPVVLASVAAALRWYEILIRS